MFGRCCTHDIRLDFDFHHELYSSFDICNCMHYELYITFCWPFFLFSDIFLGYFLSDFTEYTLISESESIRALSPSRTCSFSSRTVRYSIADVSTFTKFNSKSGDFSASQIFFRIINMYRLYSGYEGWRRRIRSNHIVNPKQKSYI